MSVIPKFQGLNPKNIMEVELEEIHHLKLSLLTSNEVDVRTLKQDPILLTCILIVKLYIHYYFIFYTIYTQRETNFMFGPF